MSSNRTCFYGNNDKNNTFQPDIAPWYFHSPLYPANIQTDRLTYRPTNGECYCKRYILNISSPSFPWKGVNLDLSPIGRSVTVVSILFPLWKLTMELWAPLFNCFQLGRVRQIDYTCVAWEVLNHAKTNLSFSNVGVFCGPKGTPCKPQSVVCQIMICKFPAGWG